MESSAALITMLAALLIGVISPGPSFLVVSRISILQSRKAGVAAAFGMGLGGALFGLLALVGLAAVLEAVPALHRALKICGGLYLLHLAVKAWRGAHEPSPLDAPAPEAHHPSSRAFWLALGVQLSNPKTAIVYAGIFTAFLPANPPPGLILALIAGVFIVEFGWYALVATLFSLNAPRAVYLNSKSAIDRGAAVVLGALGGRLLWSGITN